MINYPNMISINLLNDRDELADLDSQTIKFVVV